MKMMPKRIWVLVTAIVLIVGLLGMTAFAANNDPADELVCYDHGDVNSDGAITGEDAVYLLFASFGDLFGDEYLLSQDGDLDGDGAVTGDDAVYLLFASFGDLFGDQYPLNGTIHSYYDPIWTWNTDSTVPTAQVSLKCACGENHTITEGIAITAGIVVEPTCVASGSKEYAGSVIFNGKTYENTITVIVPALGENGHTMVGEPTCEEGVKCQNCDYTIEALGHNYVDNGEKIEGCKHTKLYKCACGSETEGDVYYTHTYTAELAEEATCTKAGKKLLTCSCGDTQEEIVPINAEFHVWGEAVTENGVTTQTCACGRTKTIVVMSDNGVSTDALKDSEVQLDGGTSVALDEDTAEQLDADKSVVIKVEQVNKDETGMSDAEKEQVGNNTIYNFSMQYNDGTPITNFSGEVTVALPYTLQEGDDVNAIDVWYIADDGSVECVKGVYSNNYVTFKTNHFSYYTVTRLTPEQRCAAYGHSMVERSKEATCTEDGYHKVFCQRCGLEEKNEVRAMLGHDYQKNEELSEDATCNAPGKLATQCTNCGHKRLQEVKQLSHKWSIETVAPTCSTKGYEKRTCSLCGTEKIDNEKEALGHSYSKDSAVWTWNEDCSKATVTLTCANDTNHTKDLNAVVTSAGGSACVGGQVTYTATASFNKITYTATATGEQEGIGHTPNSEWTSNDEKHYHICSACGEPVGEANHEWERKVIVAATCDKDGSATDTCTVCGKVVTVVMPATGKHNYKNGICTACGYVEGSCDHKKLTLQIYDLSEYGVCGGEVYIRSCECGMVRKWVSCDLNCGLVEDENENTENPNYVKYVSSCATCGLKILGEYTRVLDSENCCSYWTVNYTVIVNGSTVLETSESTDPSYHPMVVEHKPVNLADYGLCELIVTNTTCYCGLRSEWEQEEGGCDMAYDEDGKIYRCSVCGATGTIESSEGKEGCQYHSEQIITYFLNDKKVFSARRYSFYEEHSYEVVNYHMDGEICKDGVSYDYVCTECGDSVSEYYMDCVAVLQDRIIDTSANGSCSFGIRITTCACGDAKAWRFVYDDAYTSHNWDYKYDEAENTWVETCVNCNFAITSQSGEIDPSEKDEYCLVSYTVSHKYWNTVTGECFTWESKEYTSHHNSTYDFELLGETCEDGVKVTHTCSDCGLKDTYTNEYHTTYLVKTLDLGELGYCDGEVSQWSCPCEENIFIATYDSDCVWEEIDWGEHYSERRCANCGIVWKTCSSFLDSDDPCTYQTQHVDTFLDGEEVLAVFEYVQQHYSHRMVYELILNEGAETCDGGFTAIGSCIYCGNTEENTEWGCYTYPVERQTISDDEMCGVLEVVTERCACGQYNSKETHWMTETCCDFYAGEQVYNEEYKAWQYFCACGASRIAYNITLAVKDDPCQIESRLVEYYFDNEGNLLAKVESSYFEQRHDWLYEFELMGETCADGWLYTRTCADCGKTNSASRVQTSHSMEYIARELAYGSDEICGPVYLYQRSCACGEYTDTTLSTFCNMSWNNGVASCKNCKLQYEEDYESTVNPGSCLVDVTVTYTFTIDGQTVTSISSEYTNREHTRVYELILLGDTCEDGYRVVTSCAFCDYESLWEEVQYGHDTYCVEYYEAPEGSCGGSVRVVACACGQQQSVWNDLRCSMSETDRSEVDENGIYHYYITGKCVDCDMSYYRDSYEKPGADDCYRVCYVDFILYYDEITLNLPYHYTYENHDYETVNAEMKVEGSTDCDNGVIFTYRCRKCAHESTSVTYEHEMFAAESATIDLSAYGSACGAKLELRSCACGKYNNYAFSNDTQCDIGSNWTPVWIDGALNGYWYTTQDTLSAYSNAYERYCAVTDPECGLRIRMARYWLNENCTAVEYETWQLGYDPITGTYQREITIATGNRKIYHNYQEPITTETQDGNRILEDKYVCADCGCYYVIVNEYDEDNNLLKHIREAVNVLDDGNNKRRTEIDEYQVVKGSITRLTLERVECVYADDSVYWYQYEHTYSMDNGCKRITIYSNSDGVRNVGQEEEGHYNETYNSEWIKEPTCTQSGSYVERWTCGVCEQVVREQIRETTPNDHRWYYDGSKNTNVCYNCGLESKNGISGSIWLEDMSDDTSYIVGYYCANEIAFNPYVSLILYDVAEGENDELVLDSVVVQYLTEENDGICGLIFSKSATADAAAAALNAAGYTGRYAVRISCVPLSGSDYLDYAVTFNTLTAE